MEKPVPKGVLAWVRLICVGFLMGCADLVPGVSGGTIAFISGIYEDFLKSLKTLSLTNIRRFLTFQWKALVDGVAWQYLGGVGTGMAAAIVSLAGVLHRVLGHHEHRTYLYALFFGLIIASIVLLFGQIKQWTFKHIAALGIGVLLAALATSPKEKTKEPLYDVTMAARHLSWDQARNFERSQLLKVEESTLRAMLAKNIVLPTTKVFSHEEKRAGQASDFVQPVTLRFFNPYLFLCGFLAISAMLLPGISGSYVLVILGVYPVVIAAIADLVGNRDFESLKVIVNLGLGIVCGFAITSRVILFLLNRYFSIAMALLIGFMIGALRAVWPYYSYAYMLTPLKLAKGLQLQLLNPVLPDPTTFSFAISVFCAFLGTFFVFLLNRLSLKNS